MSLDTYANLKAELADKIARSDITASSSIIDTAIDLIEAEANAELRLKGMLSTATLTLVQSTETVDLPTDFIQFENLYLSTDPSPLKVDTETNIRARYPREQVGRPKVYAEYPGNKALFAPVPDSAYTAYLQYYAKIAALSDSNTSNVLLSTYPGYYYYGALRHLTTYISDPDSQAQIIAEFAKVLANIEKSEGKKRTTGSGMMAHVIGMTP